MLSKPIWPKPYPVRRDHTSLWGWQAWLSSSRAEITKWSLSTPPYSLTKMSILLKLSLKLSIIASNQVTPDPLSSGFAHGNSKCFARSSIKPWLSRFCRCCRCFSDFLGSLFFFWINTALSWWFCQSELQCITLRLTNIQQNSQQISRIDGEPTMKNWTNWTGDFGIPSSNRLLEDWSPRYEVRWSYRQSPS